MFDRSNKLAVAGFCMFAASLSSSGAATAQTIENFYRNKTVNLMVGFAPGGGADLWGRLLARHLGDFIPGKPNVVVQNMPGAGGYRSVGYVYKCGPDGRY